jgi:hypothetical protein
MFVSLTIMSIGFLALFVFGVYKVVTSDVISLIGRTWFQSLLILSSLLIVLTAQVFATYLLLAKFMIGRTAKITRIGVDGKSSTAVRNRSNSTCTSESNLLTADPKIRNSQFIAQLDIVIEDLPE